MPSNKKGQRTPGGTSSLDTSALDDSVIDAILVRIGSLLDDKLSKLEDSISKRILAVEQSVASITRENANLKNAVEVLQDKVARLETNARKGNFVIKGIPEGKDSLDGVNISSPASAIESVANAIDVKIVINSCFRLGKPRQDGSPRPILVKSTEECTSNMLRSAKKLKQVGKDFFKKIYIDKDYPPEVATLLSQLRKRAYEHRRDHPNSKAFVRNGKLFINDVVVDEVK